MEYSELDEIVKRTIAEHANSEYVKVSGSRCGPDETEAMKKFLKGEFVT